jgi:ParB/RepB/Spo0J family partition protein
MFVCTFNSVFKVERSVEPHHKIHHNFPFPEAFFGSVPMGSAGAGAAQVAEQIYLLPTTLIDPDPKQPRAYFDSAKMALLKKSIELHGVQTPGIVASKEGGRFDLIDGERRYRVCRELGIPFPVRVRSDANDQKARYVASVVTNFNRAEHTPLETAKAIQRLLGYEMTMEEVAASISMSVPTANSYRLILELHPDLQPLVEPFTPREKRLTLTLVKILVRLPVDVQVKQWEQIRAQRLSPRKLAHVLAKAVEDHGGARRLYKTGRAPVASDWMKKLTRFARMTSEQGALLAELDLVTIAKSAKSSEVVTEALTNFAAAAEALKRIREKLQQVGEH